MIAPVLTSFLQGLGIVGLVTFANEASLRLFSDRRSRSIAAALVFAFGVLATMSLPFSFGEGLRFDMRNTFLILAPVFGGLPAAVLTAAAAASFRIYMGGVGAPAGVVGIAVATAVGIGASRYPKLFHDQWKGAGLLGASACVPVLGFLVLPGNLAVQVLTEFGPAYLLSNFVGVMVASMILLRRADAAKREIKLTHEAETDPLTDLYNRRAFDRMVPALIEKAAARGLPCTMLMAHLEGMRNVNERLGRNARDVALKKAACVIAHAVPQGHLVARIGSQEFAILLLGRDQRQSAIMAENIRSAVAAEDFDVGAGSARIYVSIGVTPVSQAPQRLDTVIDRVDSTFEVTLQRVDAALQAAKRNGRNRVEVADSA